MVTCRLYVKMMGCYRQLIGESFLRGQLGQQLQREYCMFLCMFAELGNSLVSSISQQTCSERALTCCWSAWYYGLSTGMQPHFITYHNENFLLFVFAQILWRKFAQAVRQTDKVMFCNQPRLVDLFIAADKSEISDEMSWESDVESHLPSDELHGAYSSSVAWWEYTESKNVQR